MEVGDYVRIKSYGIRKIEGFSSSLTEDFVNCDYNEYQNVLINKKEIIKSSSNIIDLIKVGDYVNGYKVTCIDKHHFKLSCNPFEWWNNKDIKSIVTKEQFESMEYEVK